MLPADYDIIFTRMNLTGEKIVWAAPCISTASHGIPGNHFGYLIATVEEPHKLYFVAKSGWGKVAESLELEGCKAVQESKFLTENLVIYHTEKKIKYTFLFDRTKTALVRSLVASIQKRLASALSGASPVTSFEPEPQLETAGK